MTPFLNIMKSNRSSPLVMSAVSWKTKENTGTLIHGEDRGQKRLVMGALCARLGVCVRAPEPDPCPGLLSCLVPPSHSPQRHVLSLCCSFLF